MFLKEESYCSPKLHLFYQNTLKNTNKTNLKLYYIKLQYIFLHLFIFSVIAKHFFET